MKQEKKRKRTYYTQCLFKHITLLYMREKKRTKKKRNFMVLSIRKHTYVKNNIFYRSRIRFSLFQGEKNTYKIIK
jgi:hypothetical protein